MNMLEQLQKRGRKVMKGFQAYDLYGETVRAEIVEDGQQEAQGYLFNCINT